MVWKLWKILIKENVELAFEDNTYDLERVHYMLI